MARLDAGETVRRVAEALSVATSSVVKWSQRRRATGSAALGKVGGHVPRKITGEQARRVRARMAEGDFTLRGLVAELAAGAARSSTNPTASIGRSRWTPNETSAQIYTQGRIAA
jgi:putative transposase